jgi:hypothetical protein
MCIEVPTTQGSQKCSYTPTRIPEIFSAILHFVGGACSAIVPVIEAAPCLEVSIHEAASVARAAVDHIGVPNLNYERG